METPNCFIEIVYVCGVSAFLQIFRQSLVLSFEEIRAAKLRSALSLLGITIGILCIISVRTAVNSMEMNIQNSLASFGNDILYIQKWPWIWGDGNDYAWWKYLIIAVALLIGLIYTLPNFFGEAPAVQLSSGKATIKLAQADVARVETVLKEAGAMPDFVELDGTSVRARFKDTDTQIKARDAIARAYNPDASDPRYIVALNLVSRSPHWLRSLGAHPAERDLHIHVCHGRLDRTGQRMVNDRSDRER